MKNKECEQCGKPIIGYHSGRRRFCANCKRIRMNKRAAKFRVKKVRKIKNCEKCGSSLENNHHLKRFCDSCVILKKRELMKKYYVRVVKEPIIEKVKELRIKGIKFKKIKIEKKKTIEIFATNKEASKPAYEICPKCNKLRYVRCKECK